MNHQNRHAAAMPGFTLIEMLVALTIVGLLLVAIPLAFVKVQPTMQYHTAVRELSTAIAAARLEAIRSGEPTALTIDLEQHRFGVNDTLNKKLPEDLQIDLTLASMASNGKQGRIIFYPAGGATGGTIELHRPGGGGMRLQVDWLLGKLSRESLAGLDIAPAWQRA